jgi:hypothetical protein
MASFGSPASCLKRAIDSSLSLLGTSVMGQKQINLPSVCLCLCLCLRRVSTRRGSRYTDGCIKVPAMARIEAVSSHQTFVRSSLMSAMIHEEEARSGLVQPPDFYSGLTLMSLSHVAYNWNLQIENQKNLEPLFSSRLGKSQQNTARFVFRWSHLTRALSQDPCLVFWVHSCDSVAKVPHHHPLCLR